MFILAILLMIASSAATRAEECSIPGKHDSKPSRSICTKLTLTFLKNSYFSDQDRGNNWSSIF